jgi:vacuolar protein sorting-associated protein 11
MTPSSFGILVADIHGSIHILNHAFESTQNWQAHVNGRVTHMIEHKAILVTLGVSDIIYSIPTL